LGLVADLSEQKKFSMIQFIVYIVVFLLAVYLSYTFIISTEVKKLQSARAEYKKEKIILNVLEEKAQSINAMANNAQKLETELIDIRSRVFNEDNDILSFMRSLPATTSMTGNNLISMTPLELKPILEAPPPSSPPSGPVEGKIAAAQSVPPASQNLSCKLKPVDISFTGGYGDVIRFFDELKRTGQYMTVDNISLGGGSENSGQVSVKIVLNLLQMGVDVRTPPKQVAEITQKAIGSTGTALVNQNTTAGGRNANIATPVQTPAQITVAVKPVQKVAPIQIAKLPRYVVTPVQTIASTPSSQKAKPVVTAIKPAQKVMPVQIAKQPQFVVTPVQTIASTSSSQKAKPVVTAIKPAQKVMPVQIAKQPQFVEKPIQKVVSATPVQTAKQNGNRIMKYEVRVGIFSYYENADNLTKTLKSHQYNAWIKPYSYKGKTTYGVYVGSFETKGKATNFAESMQQKLSYIDDFVIMDVKSGIRRNY